jgi:esterase
MELAFREYGTGKNLMILLHGLMGMSDNWVGFARKLSSELPVRILLPDLRNHGMSPKSDSFTLTEIAKDILPFISDGTEGKTIIAGHSLGGLVAMDLFIHKNEAFDALTVIDIAPKTHTLSKETLFIAEKALQLHLNKLGSLGEIERALEGSGLKQPYVSLLLKNVRRGPDDRFTWKCNLKAILSTNEFIFSHKPLTLPDYFSKPVLFIRGSFSDYLTPSDYTYIEKFFPEATVEVVENAGHWPHADQPELFYSIMSEFIGGVLSC